MFRKKVARISYTNTKKGISECPFNEVYDEKVNI
jgi:hypothetical protein